MKNFRVCNHNLDNWVERKFTNAGEVVDFLESHKQFNGRFEIEWKTPVTGEYATIVNCEDGYISFNQIFKIPGVFKQLI